MSYYPTYTTLPGICRNEACEEFGEAVWCKVNSTGRPVCCTCEGDEITDPEGQPFESARDFRFAI